MRSEKEEEEEEEEEGEEQEQEEERRRTHAWRASKSRQHSVEPSAGPALALPRRSTRRLEISSGKMLAGMSYAPSGALSKNSTCESVGEPLSYLSLPLCLSLSSSSSSFLSLSLSLCLDRNVTTCPCVKTEPGCHLLIDLPIGADSRPGIGVPNGWRYRNQIVGPGEEEEEECPCQSSSSALWPRPHLACKTRPEPRFRRLTVVREEESYGTVSDLCVRWGPSHFGEGRGESIGQKNLQLPHLGDA